MRSICSTLLLGAALPLAISMTPAHAGDAGGVAAGIAGGLAAGTLLGIAAAGPHYYAPPPPVYIAPEPAYPRHAIGRMGDRTGTATQELGYILASGFANSSVEDNYRVVSLASARDDLRARIK